MDTLIVIQALERRNGMSRTGIKRATGLTHGQVLRALAALIDCGIVTCKGGGQESGCGDPHCCGPYFKPQTPSYHLKLKKKMRV